MTRQPPADEPDCCKHRGIFYPDGERRCYRHSSAEDRALVSDLDDRAKPILGSQPAWPYGPNIDVESRRWLLTWAERAELKLANTRCQGLHWLRNGRCGVRLCNRLGHWMDHVTRWTRHGKPALIIAHPYGLNHDDMREFGELAASDEWNIHVSGNGWYRHGTVSVEVWRRDAWRQYLDDTSAGHTQERATP